MRELLEELTGGHQFYHARVTAYSSTNRLPFRVSPEPFTLSQTEADTVTRLGVVVADFMQASIDLYHNHEAAHTLLDRGKPSLFQNSGDAAYTFWRPDMIMTENGFTICEIETSVFGLALAALLDDGYRQAGFTTMPKRSSLKKHIHTTTPSSGTITYTDKTAAFAGQLDYLAAAVFSGDNRTWQAKHIRASTKEKTLYRAHYLHEYVSDAAVRAVYDNAAPETRLLPSLTPQIEEKALLAFAWDTRFDTHYRTALGDAQWRFLRSLIPPTWIVGEEAWFMPGLPNGGLDTASLASLSRSKRKFVLKPSGFSQDSSWAEGVIFLHTGSKVAATAALTSAITQSTERLYVVQEFRPGVKRPMRYETQAGIVATNARVRLTPYFSTTDGELLAIKATGCEDTDRIHASSTSINTAVAVRY